MIKYFIRTTNERVLDESIKRELGDNFTLLVDLEHNSGKAFLKQLDIINEYDSVLLEDDIILCKDFKRRIEEVISAYPNEIINFFTLPMMYFKTKKSFQFVYNQCTYYPKGLPKVIKDKILSKSLQDRSQEKMMRIALNRLNLSHIIYRPCLVQHIDKGSLMDHNNVKFCRRSPYFIDYLEELGITYEDAQDKVLQEKLINLMKEKFNYD